MKHTPGPWKVSAPGIEISPNGYNGRPPWVIWHADSNKSLSPIAMVEAWKDTGKDESEANARLIAATPMLMETLKAIADHEHCLTVYNVDGLRSLARAAIRAAEGE
jgi:hypothetical protein